MVDARIPLMLGPCTSWLAVRRWSPWDRYQAWPAHLYQDPRREGGSHPLRQELQVPQRRVLVLIVVDCCMKPELAVADGQADAAAAAYAEAPALAFVGPEPTCGEGPAASHVAGPGFVAEEEASGAALSSQVVQPLAFLRGGGWWARVSLPRALSCRPQSGAGTPRSAVSCSNWPAYVAWRRPTLPPCSRCPPASGSGQPALVVCWQAVAGVVGSCQTRNQTLH